MTRYEKRVAKMRKEYEAKIKARDAELAKKDKKDKKATKADDKAVKK